MITIDRERSQEYRPHRWVVTCSPCFWIALALIWFASAPLHANAVSLSTDTTLPQVVFAASELRGALTAAGHVVTTTGLDALPDDDVLVRIVMADQEQTRIIDRMREQGAKPSTHLRPEGFSLRRTASMGRVTYWVIGADTAGVMYGGLELAEIIKTMGLERVQADDQNPYMPLRGIKFNCPLDERTPTYSNHNGDSQRQNVLVIWDMDFWKAYIDEMARFRYNYLSLWNLHPFPSMVRVPGYEKVALDDVQSVAQTLRMTIDEKMAFWREVMRYAKDRNVDVYVVTWNIFITGENGIYSTKGQYGLTPKFDNPVTTDYFRRSVKQLILTYPDLAGIGLTTGERMPDMTTAQKEAWAFATYGQGILDAAAAEPGRKIRLIHRQHQTGTQEIAKTFQPLLDHPDIDFIFSFKYAKAHVQSSTRQPYCNDFVKEIGDLKTIWTLRNDSNFYFRWGAPDFVREFIQNIPYDVSKGFYYGSDGYIWGREFLSKEPEAPRQLEMVKHWYQWMLWGRLGYNPDLSNERFVQILSARFPEVQGRDLFTAWQEASMVYPLTTGFHWGSLDFRWYIEGCCSIPSYAQTDSGFHDINRFITLGTHPGTDNIAIPDYVEAVSSGKEVEGTSPIQVSQQLHASSDKALQILDQFPKVTEKELKRTLGDIRTMAYMGKYYAHKIRGATELALYRHSKKEKYRSSAVAEMIQAASYWDLYTSTALKQYYNPVDLNRVILVDWQALRKDVRRDIANAGEDLSQAPVPD